MATHSSLASTAVAPSRKRKVIRRQRSERVNLTTSLAACEEDGDELNRPESAERAHPAARQHFDRPRPAISRNAESPSGSSNSPISAGIGRQRVRMVADHGARIVKTTGDGLLLEFPSVVAAVESAIAIQKLMAERNAETPELKRMLYRIGVNLGDVLIEATTFWAMASTSRPGWRAFASLAAC